ncbi:hypothetical protein I3842_15G091600 [Carya illinoinensis]|uniref:Uncharacterized protein n=1 Tax=Carya illinoinensis TaxID=32201 RepID=A0A922DAY6_CARIL|nr:hypothetical protein I3842_15G091600 [Carya illinoinensis]
MACPTNAGTLLGHAEPTHGTSSKAQATCLGCEPAAMSQLSPAVGHYTPRAIMDPCKSYVIAFIYLFILSILPIDFLGVSTFVRSIYRTIRHFILHLLTIPFEDGLLFLRSSIGSLHLGYLGAIREFQKDEHYHAICEFV